MGVRKQIWVFAIAAAIGVGGVGLKLSRAAEKSGEKDSEITTIMKKAFKGSRQKPSIVQKAAQGKASQDELKSLLGYTQDLTKTKPPKGEQSDWDERTSKLVKAVEALNKGEKSAGGDLKAAANCKECHKLHKED